MLLIELRGGHKNVIELIVTLTPQIFVILGINQQNYIKFTAMEVWLHPRVWKIIRLV